MTPEQQHLPYNLEETYFLPFGNFYMYDSFMIAEIGQGVVFTQDMADTAIQVINKHYGDRKNIGYISHQVNTYQVDTKAMAKFAQNDKKFIGYATVPSKGLKLHKLFKFISERYENAKFDTLLEASSWITSLNILMKNKRIKE